MVMKLHLKSRQPGLHLFGYCPTSKNHTGRAKHPALIHRRGSTPLTVNSWASLVGPRTDLNWPEFLLLKFLLHPLNVLSDEFDLSLGPHLLEE